MVNDKRQMCIELARRLDQRYASAVSKKLGCKAVHLRNEEYVTPKGVKTGATIPVFGVPIEFLESARMYGLLAEALPDIVAVRAFHNARVALED